MSHLAIKPQMWHFIHGKMVEHTFNTIQYRGKGEGNCIAPSHVQNCCNKYAFDSHLRLEHTDISLNRVMNIINKPTLYMFNGLVNRNAIIWREITLFAIVSWQNVIQCADRVRCDDVCFITDRQIGFWETKLSM